MKKSLHLLLVGNLFSAVSAFAQPVLTAAGINPTVGISNTSNAANYVSPGGSGVSQTWNLSAMTSTGSSVTTFIAPSSTTYASSFPSANVAINLGSGSYSYYKTSSTAWQNEGVASGSGPVIMSYSNPEDFLRYPFTFNSGYTDTWATTFVSGTTTFYRTGSTVVTADSYGTLITPSGTFSNVLRVHFYEDYQDSANISGNPFIIPYQNDEYMWYLNGNHNPIATVWSLTANASTSQGGSYMINVSGINEPSSLVSFNIFPNPASENLTIDISLKEKQKVDIKLFDEAGSEAGCPVSAEAMQGKSTYAIAVQDLPAGIYFAEVILNGTSSSTRRFIVSK